MVLQKDFDSKIYLVHSDGNPDLEQWLKSGHDWKTYPFSNHIDVVAGKYKEDHEYCNGPLCLTCGYNPCWHCEPIPEPCPGRKRTMKTFTNIIREGIAQGGIKREGYQYRFQFCQEINFENGKGIGCGFYRVFTAAKESFEVLEENDFREQFRIIREKRIGE